MLIARRLRRRSAAAGVGASPTRKRAECPNHKRGTCYPNVVAQQKGPVQLHVELPSSQADGVSNGLGRKRPALHASAPFALVSGSPLSLTARRRRIVRFGRGEWVRPATLAGV